MLFQEQCSSGVTCSSGAVTPLAPAATSGLQTSTVSSILMCNEGYQSSLAAATLQRLGFQRATDLTGGFQAWRDAGLPVSPPDNRRS